VANLSLVFDILARDSASPAFRSAGNSAERAGKQGEQAGGLISKGMKLAGGALLGAGLIEGFKSLYDAAAESAKIGRLTEQVIRSTGGAAGISAKQVGDLAGAISDKTGMDDEAIQSGENLLLTFTNLKNGAGEGNDIFDQTTQIMTDMAAALGGDASSQAIRLGKALNDPVKGMGALSKAGVSFTQEQKDQVAAMVDAGDMMGAQKVILGELTKEFGGAAAAAGTPFEKLQVAVGNLAEEAGSYLIPVVDDLSGFITDDLLPGLSDTGAVIGGTVGPVFSALGTSAKFAVDVFKELPGPLQVGVVALGAIAALKGPASSMFETVALKAMYMGDAIKGAGSPMGALKAGAGGLMGLFGGPWGIAITGATVGLGFLFDMLNKTGQSTKETEQATSDYASALEAAHGAINKNTRDAAAKAAQDAGLLDVAENLGIATTDVTAAITEQGPALDRTRASLQAYIDAHSSQVALDETGQTTTVLDDEGQAAQDAMDALNKLSGQTGKTKADQDQLKGATEGAAGAMGTGAAAADAFQKGLEDTAGAASDAKKETDLFKTALDILTGENISTAEAEIAFNDALRAGKDALKGVQGSAVDAAGGLDTQSEAGSKAADVLFGVVDAANTNIATMKEHGATQDEVAAADAHMRQGFIDTAIQMGFNGDQAKALADKYYGIPTERTTTLFANPAPAKAVISDLANYTNNFINQPHTITVDADLGPARSRLQELEREMRNSNPIPIPTYAPLTGPRAEGGPVLGGNTYLVGERGPELVTFGGSGFVTPADLTAQALAAASRTPPGLATGGLVGAGAGGMRIAGTLDLGGGLQGYVEGTIIGALDEITNRGRY
jgi:hypothetical protein